MAKATLGAEYVPIKLPPILAFIMGVPIAPRIAVERTIQRAIDALDDMDPDPDRESPGLEDDFEIPPMQLIDRGPGCPVSDPGGDCASEDEPCGHSQAPGDFGPGCPISDPGGGNVTDEPHDALLEDDRYV